MPVEPPIPGAPEPAPAETPGTPQPGQPTTPPPEYAPPGPDIDVPDLQPGTAPGFTPGQPVA
jgi:hypothetical protein